MVKLFVSSDGTYKYQKTTEKLAKAFERFLSIFLQLCNSRFWLFWKKNLDANPKAGELKRNYLERDQAYKRNMEECKSLHLQVRNKDYWKQQMLNAIYYIYIKFIYYILYNKFWFWTTKLMKNIKRLFRDFRKIGDLHKWSYYSGAMSLFVVAIYLIVD